jgi:YegS/Rv2252/BmrU family lipid kinase
MAATVVLNVHSRKAGALRDRVSELLARYGVEIEAVEATERNEDLTACVARAVERGAGSVIVGGGDGSMTAAVAALAHRTTIMGVLPLGTGNSFAATLGIGDDLEKAVAAIAAGRVAAIDLGVVNERYFANFATIGLPAELALAASAPLKRIFGPLAYVLGGIVPGWRHRPFGADICSDGERRMDLRTHHIVITSGRTYGKTPLTPDAHATDGLLTLFTSDGLSRTDLVRTYAAFAVGAQTQLPDAHVLSAKTIEIRAMPPQPVNVDGEAAGTTPAHFRIAARALRVFVPPEFFGNES